MQSLVYLSYFFQKVSTKNLGGGGGSTPPLVKEGLKELWLLEINKFQTRKFGQLRIL